MPLSLWKGGRERVANLHTKKGDNPPSLLSIADTIRAPSPTSFLPEAALPPATKIKKRINQVVDTHPYEPSSSTFTLKTEKPSYRRCPKDQ